MSMRELFPIKFQVKPVGEVTTVGNQNFKYFWLVLVLANWLQTFRLIPRSEQFRGVLMEHEAIIVTVVSIVGLLLVAALSAILLRLMRLPYTVGLVLIGLVLGALKERSEGMSCDGTPPLRTGTRG